MARGGALAWPKSVRLFIFKHTAVSSLRFCGAGIFEKTKAPPLVSSCQGKYTFGAAEAGGNCPVPSALAFASAIPSANLVAIADTGGIANGKLPICEDGGMHKSPKALLKREGPQKMARMVPLSSEPVSRPKAALANAAAILLSGAMLAEPVNVQD